MGDSFLANRPMPPADLFDLSAASFVPAVDMAEWATATFIEEAGPLANEDHAHLAFASIGFLWTVVENTRKGRRVIGTAEPGAPQGAMGKWGRARVAQQTAEWFGAVPDFIITIDASWWAAAPDADCCALIEHELYHCAQESDDFGQPRFNKDTGRPAFGMKGHDVEQFVGVVRRYGADASGVRDLVEAANRGPEIAAADISHACGTCRQRAA